MAVTLVIRESDKDIQLIDKINMDDNRLIDQDTGEILNQKDFLLPKPSGNIIIQAMEEGRTNYVPHVINGNNYKIVVMGDKQYIHSRLFFLQRLNFM